MKSKLYIQIIVQNSVLLFVTLQVLFQSKGITNLYM